MFLTTHAVASLATLKITQNPTILFGINFLLHYVLDIIPHGDWGFIKGFKNWKLNYIFLSGLDFFFVCIVSLIYIDFQPHNNINMFSAILGSILPDILWGINAFLKLKFLKVFENLNSWAHNVWGNQQEQRIYFLIQLLTIGIALLIIY
ncbi:MAG TPA: hypothetical protein PKL13_02315 [bacterium]|nr:hypothetical protein [bacterium]